MAETMNRITSVLRRLSPLVVPTLFVLMSIPAVTLFRGCVSDAEPYALIVAHEAPATGQGAFSLGSGGSDALLLTEPRVEEGHGELVDAGQGAWTYLHRTDRAGAEFQNPGSLGRWSSPRGAPRHVLAPGVQTVVLSGLPLDPDADQDPCDPVRQEQHVRHLLQPVDAARVAIRVDGDPVGAVDVPLVAGQSIELGRGHLAVCGAELDLRYGACDDGVPLPAPVSRLSLRPTWTEVPGLTAGAFGRVGGAVSLARVDGTVLTDRDPGLRQSHVLVDDGVQVRVLAVHDRRQPVHLDDPLGHAPSLSVARKRARGPVELLASPRPGTRVVRCAAPVRRAWDPRTWGEREPVAVEMGRARIESGGLLIVGTSRFALRSGVERPWGAGGRAVEVMRLEPAERPENFHLLSSLSAGRLLQRRGGFTLPECGRGERAWAVVRAKVPRDPDEAAGALARAGAAEAVQPARVRVDERVEPNDGARLRQASIDLPVPSWALSEAGGATDGVPVLHLCHSGSTIKSRPLAEPGARGALGPVLEDPERAYEAGVWMKHRWGDRVAVAGQVLELRGGLARYERTVPLLLLWIILGLAAWRMLHQIGVLRRQIGPGLGGRAAAVSQAIVFAVVFLLLAGCLLMGRMAAHPRLLANPDYLHRTWFSAVIAAFALPACLSFFVASGNQLLEGARGRDWLVGLAAAAREFGLALMVAAVAGVVDGLLWWLLDGLAPLEPIRVQIRLTIAALVVVGLLLYAAPVHLPRLWDRLGEWGRGLTRRVGARYRAWRERRRRTRPSAAAPSAGIDPRMRALAMGLIQPEDEADPEDEAADPQQDPAGWRQLRDVVFHHPWTETVFGPGARDLVVVVAAPLLLFVGSVIARLGGGAAHNNIEFGIGLGLKPADLLIIVIGLAVATSLTRHWDRGGSVVDPRPGPGGPALQRLQAWVVRDRPLPAGRRASGWLIRGLLGALPAAAALLAWKTGLVTLAPALIVALSALVLTLAPPTWLLVGITVVTVRYGVHALVVVSSVGLWALGLVGAGVAVPALVGVAAIELLIRLQPQLASLLAVLGLLVVVTVGAFAAQGDFGPLMVTVPAMLATGAYWAMVRPREKAGSAWKRGLVVVILVGLMVPGVWAGVELASSMADQVPDFQRAADRLLIWQEPWYAIGADWSVRGRWIAAGAFGHDQAVWVANLHSDLAWVAVLRSYGVPVAMAVLFAYFVICFVLLRAAEETLAKAAYMELRDDRRRHQVRGAGLFAAFASFYLAAEVFVHVATCFTRIPPTGLTLPWISNGGSAALGYALLVGVAMGAVLVAHREAVRDDGGVR